MLSIKKQKHVVLCCEGAATCTDLADVSSGEADQRGEPVCDVEQSLGDASPLSEQRTVDEGHAADAALPVRPLKKVRQYR